MVDQELPDSALSRMEGTHPGRSDPESAESRLTHAATGDALLLVAVACAGTADVLLRPADPGSHLPIIAGGKAGAALSELERS